MRKGQTQISSVKPYQLVSFDVGSLKFCCLVKGEPFLKRQILDSSKLKEFADDNFKFNENGGKISKRVENTVGKGEIARYEQFLLFPQCFNRFVLQTLKNQGLFGKRLTGSPEVSSYCSRPQDFVLAQINPFPHNDTF